MASLDIYELEAREEAAEHRQSFIGDVGALGPAYHERRPLEPGAVRIEGREVAHGVELAREVAERDAPGHGRLAVRALLGDEVREQELPDGVVLLCKRRVSLMALGFVHTQRPNKGRYLRPRPQNLVRLRPLPRPAPRHTEHASH